MSGSGKIISNGVKKLEGMINQKFNSLTVIARAGTAKNRDALWLCKCDCGGEAIVRGYSLRKGLTKSCGCLRRRQMRENPLRLSHGMSKTATYRSWSSMKARVLNKHNHNYKYYGGRGIEIDPNWLIFEHFFHDMGIRPEGTKIDRIDNDGPYCKSNCRWANSEIQANNQRRNTIIHHEGKTRTLSEWCRELNLPYEKTRNRIKYLKWTIQKAFSEH
jgi:hypothetical protein